MIEFIGGILVGAFGLAVLALHFSNKAKKPEAKPEPQIHCATLGDTSVEAYDAYLLKRSLTEVDEQTLYEIRPRFQ
jgi:hypothetical protein